MRSTEVKLSNYLLTHYEGCTWEDKATKARQTLRRFPHDFLTIFLRFPYVDVSVKNRTSVWRKVAWKSCLKKLPQKLLQKLLQKSPQKSLPHAAFKKKSPEKLLQNINRLMMSCQFDQSFNLINSTSVFVCRLLVRCPPLHYNFS